MQEAGIAKLAMEKYVLLICFKNSHTALHRLQSQARHCKARQMHLKDDVRIAAVQDALSLYILEAPCPIRLSVILSFGFMGRSVLKVVELGFYGREIWHRRSGDSILTGMTGILIRKDFIRWI